MLWLLAITIDGIAAPRTTDAFDSPTAGDLPPEVSMSGTQQFPETHNFYLGP